MKGAIDLKAGVIGLGHIGGGVASSLANSGRIPVVYDIVPEAYKNHEGLTGQLDTPADVAASSDIIMIAVFTFEQCREVIMGEQGLLKGAHEGMVLVSLSTIGVQQIKELYDICKEKGVGFLDCGVTPGSLASKNGLVAMVGGDKDVFEYARPVLDDWASTPFYCGQSGTGMACKIARNVNTYGGFRITAESFRLATAAGVDPQGYIDVLEAADKVDSLLYQMIKIRAQSPDLKVHMPPTVTPVSEYMKKDLQASKELSDALGVSMPVRDDLFNYCYDTFDEES